MSSPGTGASLDAVDLEAKVKAMYRAVAEDPGGSYHFELGRQLADRLGYPSTVLDTIPAEAVASFAGVGYFFDLADVQEGEAVLDLGSGSGMDTFFAAALVGAAGRAVGIDMTPEQLAKAGRLRGEAGLDRVAFVEGHIDELPFPDDSFDVVISNGVVNLVPDKRRVFSEAARVLRPGGRLALADIVSEVELTPEIVANADLWASCVGGAAQQDAYLASIEAGGLRVELMRRNPYRFSSVQALNASDRFGVKSVSLLARARPKPAIRR
jgi:arsenite methyltransferase